MRCSVVLWLGQLLAPQPTSLALTLHLAVSHHRKSCCSFRLGTVQPTSRSCCTSDVGRMHGILSHTDNIFSVFFPLVCNQTHPNRAFCFLSSCAHSFLLLLCKPLLRFHCGCSSQIVLHCASRLARCAALLPTPGLLPRRVGRPASANGAFARGEGGAGGMPLTHKRLASRNRFLAAHAAQPFLVLRVCGCPCLLPRLCRRR